MAGPDGPGAVTRCLQEWRAGDESAIGRLGTELYQELHRLSGSILSPHKPCALFQPTVLLHELYMRLPNVRTTDWQSRAQFFNTAARMMRNILVDHARRRQALKRGGDLVSIPLDAADKNGGNPLDPLIVHQALERLAEEYPRHARHVELRFFGGLSAEETVDVFRLEGMEYSVRTAERDWKFSKAWLQNYLGPV